MDKIIEFLNWWFFDVLYGFEPVWLGSMLGLASGLVLGIMLSPFAYALDRLKA